jgi:hypothetical protein
VNRLRNAGVTTILIWGLYAPAFVAAADGWVWFAFAWLIIGHALLIGDVITLVWRTRQRLEHGRFWYWRALWRWRRHA